MADLTGQSLGRYHILEQLGEGGMATVYKAYDTRLETDVAVKVIRTESLPQNAVARALKRFEREAKALARLMHPNIVKVSDYGEYERQPYLVMPYLSGGTLKEKMGQPMPWAEAVQLLLPIAEALGYAHKQGMVHRDVKPSNILLTEGGQPMLTDFGVAKVLEMDETMDLTGTSAAVGTPEYMAPEQAVAKTVDHRADIYALGVVLYEMVTGRKPYQGDTPLAVLFKHASEPLPRPKSFVPSLPSGVERVLLKALAKKPGDRYQSMAELAGALKAQTNIGQRMLKKQPKEKPLSPAPERSLSRRRFLPWLGGAGLIATGLVLGLFFFGRLGQAPVSEETPVKTETAFEAVIPESGISTGYSETRAKDRMTVVYIPAGEFNMGSKNGYEDERPIHTVYLDEFWLDQTEVTNSMFAVFLNELGNQSEGGVNWLDSENAEIEIIEHDGGWQSKSGFENFPVTEVSWYGSRAYCEWAEARLPTEAEWEKAARGADERTYPWGEGITCGLAEYGSCGSRTVPVTNHPGGASPYGVLQMAGNVSEWVNDWYQSDYYSLSPSEDPQGPEQGKERVLRGGSWANYDYGVRSAGRLKSSPVLTDSNTGFRCAKSASKVEVSLAAQSTQIPESVMTDSPISSNEEEITDSAGLPMRLVKAGEFIMGMTGEQAAANCRVRGSECSPDWFSEPNDVHTVFLETYYIDKYEVTNAAYLACEQAGICQTPRDVASGTREYYYAMDSPYLDYPVINVDWNMAKIYCGWRDARLPSEAEWEKAARGVDGRIYPWGNDFDVSYANVLDSVGDTTAVGSYEQGRSPFGVYDMAGNVKEWVADWYSEEYYRNSPLINPLGPVSGENRVIKGDAWYFEPQKGYHTLGGHNNAAPTAFNTILGFRCVRSTQ